jgi:MFS family permease
MEANSKRCLADWVLGIDQFGDAMGVTTVCSHHREACRAAGAIAFRSFPPKLRGAAMGMISLIGNVGAFIGPYAVGYVREATGSFTSGMLILVGSLFVAAVLAGCIRAGEGAGRACDDVPRLPGPKRGLNADRKSVTATAAFGYDLPATTVVGGYSSYAVVHPHFGTAAPDQQRTAPSIRRSNAYARVIAKGPVPELVLDSVFWSDGAKWSLTVQASL